MDYNFASITDLTKKRVSKLLGFSKTFTRLQTRERKASSQS